MLRRFVSDYHLPAVFLADNDGTEGGGSTEGDTNTEGANTGNDAGKQSDTPGAITFKSEAELQAEIDRRLKDRLAREDKKREKAADDAKRQAEEAALKDQQKFQELADKQAKRLAELEPLTDQIEAHKADAEKYKAALMTQLETLRKDLPAPIISLLDNLDPIQQMAWISKNAAEIVGKDGKTAIIKASPKGDGKLSRDDLIQQEIEAQRARRR